MPRVAVVTGGTRGIGRAMSEALKDAGYNVAATYAGNEEAAQRFKSETGIPVFKFDVAGCNDCAEGVKAIEAAAVSLGVLVIAAPVRATGDIELALESFARQPNGGLILTSDTFTTLRGSLIANLAGRYILPSIASGASFAKNGGLMYYGSDISLADEYRRAATYVDRILKGEKPADLPVQATTKYELAINLKTAKALGLDVSRQLRSLASEVIE